MGTRHIKSSISEASNAVLGHMRMQVHHCLEMADECHSDPVSRAKYSRLAAEWMRVLKLAHPPKPRVKKKKPVRRAKMHSKPPK